jgi:diaminopimelate epimerase
MNGAGNDFIILNNLEENLPPEKLPELARVLCDRRMSIGADGLMAVDRATVPEADYRMRFYNSDGSVGEMCGNGARCICRFGFEHGLAGENQTVQTTAGLVTGRRIDRRNYRIRLNSPTKIVLTMSVQARGKNWTCSYLELGSPGLPHAVVEYPGLREADERELFELGRELRRYREFPKGANVNFFELTGPDTLWERTFERGVEDFTYACGTGTGCTVTALTLQGRVSGKNVRVGMKGGELVIDVDRKGGSVENLWLTGPTNLVAQGEVLDEELPL